MNVNKIIQKPIMYFFPDIEYLMQTLPQNIEAEFFAYLKDLTCKDIKVSAIEEGSVVFPRYDYFLNFF